MKDRLYREIEKYVELVGEGSVHDIVAYLLGSGFDYPTIKLEKIVRNTLVDIECRGKVRLGYTQHGYGQPVFEAIG